MVLLLLATANAAAAASRGAGPAGLLSQPHILFTTKDTQGGLLGVADYGAPGTSHAITSFACQQVDFAGGKGVCLKTTASKAAPYEGFVFDGALHFLRHLTLSGNPLAVRVRNDGLVAAYTVGAYADRDEVTGPPPLTRVFFVELATGKTLPLDGFAVLHQPKKPAGVRLFADVTFDAAHLNRFYAVMVEGRRHELVRGDWTRGTVTVVRQNVESPAVSPEGTKIAYITVGAHPQLSVLDLATGRSHTVAEHRDVEDQPTWLDANRILYVVETKQHRDNLWGSARRRLRQAASLPEGRQLPVRRHPVERNAMSRVVGRLTVGLYRGAVRARNKLFSIFASGAFAEFGSNTVIDLPVRLVGEQRIALGSRVFIGGGAWLQVLEHPEGSKGVAIRVGDNCGFAGGTVLSAVSSISIGDHVYFARGCYVADHSHAYSDVTRDVASQGLTDIRPVTIEDGVWLGENVVVLPGVHIGKGAVVGSNSVVNSNLPSYCVALGVPARIVRRFGPENESTE